MQPLLYLPNLGTQLPSIGMSMVTSTAEFPPGYRALLARQAGGIEQGTQLVGLFPKAIKLGPRAKGWLASEIAAWQHERIAQRNTTPRNRSDKQCKTTRPTSE